MTDQRNRVTTDPGLGPIDPDHPSTLRSIAAADPISDLDPVIEVIEVIEEDDDGFGAPVYYEPKPLNAVSDHKTLELETVKLAKDIDPRRLPTQLKMRRPVLHVLPASDPNWPAPLPASGSASAFAAQYDSNWPPPETVVTTSQPPLAARRRSFIPLVLMVLLGATLLAVLGVNARRRSALSTPVAPAAPAAPAAQAATLSGAAAPNQLEGSRRVPPSAAIEPTSAGNAESATGSAASAPSSASAVSAASASAQAADSAAPVEVSELPLEVAPNAAPARLADGPHHAAAKPVSASSANSAALSAPPTAKPKRAIY